MKQQKGVTLVELMITVSIVAIILTLVGPSIQSILIKNSIVAEINETSSLIQYARHHAIDEQAEVVVCPSKDYSVCSNDWNDPKIVFIDKDDNAIRAVTEELLVTSGSSSLTSLMTNTTDIIKFTGTGEANETTEILLCHKDGKSEYTRSSLRRNPRRSTLRPTSMAHLSWHRTPKSDCNNAKPSNIFSALRPAVAGVAPSL